eukprot:scaffold47568_cov16-Prasinocladus_malaysianus.AAC.1
MLGGAVDIFWKRHGGVIENLQKSGVARRSWRVQWAVFCGQVMGVTLGLPPPSSRIRHATMVLALWLVEHVLHASV